MKLYKNFTKIVALIFLCISIIACTRLTQENFDKVKQNMTTKEVIAILGEPTRSDSINLMGLSGTLSTWKDANAEINIQFLNDKVFAKSYTKSKNESQDNSKNNEEDING